MIWPLGRTGTGSDSSGPKWGSVCTWSGRRAQTCWGDWVWHSGCTWCCAGPARLGWWSLWRSPGKGRGESGRGRRADCWGWGSPRTPWRCSALDRIPHRSNPSWSGDSQNPGRTAEERSWDRSCLGGSHSALGTLCGTLQIHLDKSQQHTG